jgi:regulator of nucleoside diphosphate kinase
MTDRSMIVAECDVERLRRLVRALKYSLFRDQRQLELLDQALESAEVRRPGRVPRDVVRMNSRVRVLDFDTRRKGMYTLVFPEEATSREASFQFLRRWGLHCSVAEGETSSRRKFPGGSEG